MGLPACVVVRTELGTELAGDGSLSAIVPGKSRVWDLVTLLGPPEEWRGPSLMDLSRAVNEPAQRVTEEREVFSRQRLTWVCEQRDDDLFLFVPVLTFFGWISRQHHTDRIVVLLDDAGVVEHVAVTRERASS